MTAPAQTLRLSKSRFVAGSQCHKLLWLRVHEPDAEELQPDKVLQDRFDQGAMVGALARERFPGGVLINLPHYAVDERLAATRQALESGAPAIFEATFVADDTFVAVDVLERVPGGWRLIEVKSSSSQKDEHVTDAAIQLYVLRQSVSRFCLSRSCISIESFAAPIRAISSVEPMSPRRLRQCRERFRRRYGGRWRCWRPQCPTS